MGGIQRIRKGERPPVFCGSVAVEERMEAMAIGPHLFRAGRGSHAMPASRSRRKAHGRASQASACQNVGASTIGMP